MQKLCKKIFQCFEIEYFASGEKMQKMRKRETQKVSTGITVSHFRNEMDKRDMGDI